MHFRTDRRKLHSLIAAVAAVLMLLPYVPLPRAETAPHEHCIHCTENYCTMGGCTCEHKRSAHHAHAGREGDAPNRRAAVHAAAHDHTSEAGSSNERTAIGVDADGGFHDDHVTHERMSRDRHVAHEETSGDRDMAYEETSGDHQAIHHPEADDATWNVALEPCGSSSIALLLPTLDKFVPSVRTALSPQTPDRSAPRPASCALSGRTVHDIFRPPISGA